MAIPMMKIRQSGDRFIFNMLGDPCTAKTTSLYWVGPQETITKNACIALFCWRGLHESFPL